MDKKTGKVLYTYSAKEFQGTKSEMNRMRSSHAEANEKHGLERGKNYFKEGEKPPEYIDSIKELRRKTAEAEKVYESLSIDDLNDFIRERDETKQFAKEVAEAFANDDKPTLIKVAKKLPPKSKARRKNSRDM
jgi:glutaredoxin-related protein